MSKKMPPYIFGREAKHGNRTENTVLFRGNKVK